MKIIDKAIEFENRKHTYKSTNEKIVASREVKNLILDLNEVYKKNKDSFSTLKLTSFKALIPPKLTDIFFNSNIYA